MNAQGILNHTLLQEQEGLTIGKNQPDSLFPRILQPSARSAPDQENWQETLILAQTLVDRLEKIPSDSCWAHRASGLRASLAKMVSRNPPTSPSSREGTQLLNYMNLGFVILEKAAAQIPGDD